MTGSAAVMTGIAFVLSVSAVPPSGQTAAVSLTGCQSSGTYIAPSPSGGDDRVALQTVIDQAITCLQVGINASATVSLAQGGSYNLSSNPSHYSALTLMTADMDLSESVMNLVLDGNGATLRVDPLSRGAIYMRACNGCIIRNLTLRWSEPAGTQGLVTSVNPANGVMDVKIQDRYVVAEAPDISRVKERRIGGDSGWHANFRVLESGQIQNHVTYPAAGKANPYIEIDHIIKTGPNTVRIFGVDGPSLSKNLAAVVPGQTVVSYPIYYDGREKINSVAVALEEASSTLSDLRYDSEYLVGNSVPMLYITQSNDVTVHTVTITNFQGHGMQAEGNGKITVRFLKIKSDGTGGLWTNDRAGLSFQNNRGPISVTGSFFENTGDDSLTFTTSPWVPSEVVNATSIRVGSRAISDVLREGDKMALYNSNTERIVSRLTLASVKPVRGPGGGTTYTLHFSTPHGVPAAHADEYAFIDLSLANPGSQVVNNTFLGGLRSAIVTRSGITISGNTFLNYGIGAIGHGAGADRPNASSLRGSSFGDFEVLTMENNLAMDLDGPFLQQSSGTAVLPYKGAVMNSNKFIRTATPVIDQTGSSVKTTGTNNHLYVLSTNAGPYVADSAWSGALLVHKLTSTNLDALVVDKNPVPLISLKIIKNIYGLR
jgi:hypothetical protein